jgi:hypothetical protein
LHGSFWKATGDFCAIFRSRVQKICQETAGRLFIEDGVVVISNEKSACVEDSQASSICGCPRRFQFEPLIEMGWRRAMADGREERGEQEKRREEERRRDLEDRLERAPIDPWKPERNES